MYKIVVVDDSGKAREHLKNGKIIIVTEVADLQSLQKLQNKFDFDAVLISGKIFTQILSKNNGKRRTLTKREKEVLCLKKQSKTNREVSEILCISMKTVEKHSKNIKRKLGVQSILEAVAKYKNN
jgi:DNA-binding CsgD family transcriptional regulator